MRRSKPISIGEALRQWAGSSGIRGPFARGRVVATWEDLLGERVRQHVTHSRVRGNKLIVTVDSSAWRQELHMRRADWCRRLNEELGDSLISEIVFR